MSSNNTPEEEELTLYRGESFSRPYLALNEDGTPIDLSDKTILAQIRKLKTSANAVRSFTPQVEDAEEGWFSIVMHAEDFVDIKCGETVSHPESQYRYDVRVLWPDGPGRIVRTIAAGPLLVSCDVSRPVATPTSDVVADGGDPGGGASSTVDGGGP